jgi:acetylornithine aminotransferase
MPLQRKLKSVITVGLCNVCSDIGTTFGGNPLAARLAHHVFQRLSSPEMLSQIAITSQLFQNRLATIKETYPELVDEVRGRGLILGIQLNSIGGKSSSDIAGLIVQAAREKGLLIITAGEGTIRLVPPLNIPQEAAVDGLTILEEAMRDVSMTL